MDKSTIFKSELLIFIVFLAFLGGFIHFHDDGQICADQKCKEKHESPGLSIEEFEKYHVAIEALPDSSAIKSKHKLMEENHTHAENKL